ncbi:MAG TPA: PQQ-binding-like beta-propeller repeat protein [Solirubrobacteraceae bacterium]
MPSPGPRRWLRRVLIAAGVVLLLAAGAVVAVILHSPGNVSHPNVEFTAPTTSTTAPTRPKPTRVVNNFQWPRYGYDLGRTRDFPNSSRLNPPLHRGWKYNDGALLEFPPVIYQNTMYLIDDDGSARAINKLNGHELWKRKVGTLAAASPAVDTRHHLILVPLMSVNPGARLPSNGRMLALSMKTGRTVWTHVVGAGTETSPTVFGQSVYYGDEAGNVASLQTRTGHVNWVYHASGAVKGGPAIANGTLYFGDYGGHVYAVNAFTGHQVWRVGTSGTHFGFGSGNFYSTAAVAFGRVYLGNTDGRVYSFAQRTGQLAWATSTGSYVYGSPAVAEIPGLGPTVYVGSYDDNFYAFDARSGAVRWKHPAGGKISGSATIVGNVVYYSNLGTKSTAGLDVRTGQKVFAFSDGAFNPVIADPTAIYMVGYGAIYQFLPERASKTSTSAQHKSAHKARTKTKG